MFNSSSHPRAAVFCDSGLSLFKLQQQTRMFSEVCFVNSLVYPTILLLECFKHFPGEVSIGSPKLVITKTGSSKSSGRLVETQNTRISSRVSDSNIQWQEPKILHLYLRFLIAAAALWEGGSKQSECL